MQWRALKEGVAKETRNLEKKPSIVQQKAKLLSHLYYKYNLSCAGAVGLRNHEIT